MACPGSNGSMIDYSQSVKSNLPIMATSR